MLKGMGIGVPPDVRAAQNTNRLRVICFDLKSAMSRRHATDDEDSFTLIGAPLLSLEVRTMSSVDDNRYALKTTREHAGVEEGEDVDRLGKERVARHNTVDDDLAPKIFVYIPPRDDGSPDLRWWTRRRSFASTMTGGIGH